MKIAFFSSKNFVFHHCFNEANELLSSRNQSQVYCEFNGKEHFCVESASQWVLCCNDFLYIPSLTIDSTPPKHSIIYMVTATPSAGIPLLKKINFLSSGLLTLSQRCKLTANWKGVEH